MNEYYQGRVLEITEIISGSELTVDHLAGTTLLSVYGTEAFEESGGQVMIDDEVYTYAPIVDEEDMLTITPGLMSDAEADLQVFMYPLVVEKRAMVEITGLAEDAVMARVPNALYDALDAMMREPSAQESVQLAQENGDWVITDVIGSSVSRDGSYIEPGTIPDVDPINPPAASPVLSVVGLNESLILQTEDIEPTTWLTYEASTDGGVTWDALPNMPVRSTIIPTKTLPDGSAYEVGATYYFRVMAGNAAGNAPAPSDPVAGSLDTSVISYIASQLIAEQVIAGFALLGRVEVGGNNFTLSVPGDPETPEGGLKIELSNGGLIHLPADGSPPRMIGVERIEVENLDVTGLEVRGASHLGGEIEVGAGINNPTNPPTAEAFYDNLIPIGASLSDVRGFCRNVANTGWVILSMGNDTIYEIDDAGNILDTAPATFKFRIGTSPFISVEPRGITRLGSRYYLIGFVTTAADQWRVWSLNSSLSGGDSDFLILDHTDATSVTIGQDGTNLLVALDTGTSTVMRKYDITGSNLAQVTLSGVTGSGGLGGIYNGSADIGASRWFLQQRSADIKVYNVNVLQSGESWPRTSSESVRGLWWDGSNFFTCKSNGRIQKYESATAAPAATYGFSYAWVDSDTHTTSASPERTFTRPKRAKIKIKATVAPQVGEVGTHVADRVQIYGATPNGGTKTAQGSALTAGVIETILTSVATGGSAPTNNWSGVTNPGRIFADAGGFEVNGNSDGSVGDGTFRNSVVSATHRGKSNYNSDGSIGTSEANYGTVAIPAVRNGAVYKVSVYGNVAHSNAGSTFTVRLKFGSGASVGGTVICESILTMATASRRYHFHMTGDFTYTGSNDAANQNVVLTAEASASGGTMYGSLNGSRVNVYVERIA